MVKCEYCQRDLLKGLNDENVRRHKKAWGEWLCFNPEVLCGKGFTIDYITVLICYTSKLRFLNINFNPLMLFK